MAQALEQNPEEKTPVAVLTPDELEALNLASTLHGLARENFLKVWAPIKEAHGLSDGVTYNRETGEVVDNG